MNKEQRRKELKRARFERSRRERHWDGAEVTERVFGPVTTPPPQPAPSQSSGLGNTLMRYMRAMGVMPPTIDVTDKEPKQAEIIKPSGISVIMRTPESEPPLACLDTDIRDALVAGVYKDMEDEAAAHAKPVAGEVTSVRDQEDAARIAHWRNEIDAAGYATAAARLRMSEEAAKELTSPPFPTEQEIIDATVPHGGFKPGELACVVGHKGATVGSIGPFITADFRELELRMAAACGIPKDYLPLPGEQSVHGACVMGMRRGVPIELVHGTVIATESNEPMPPATQALIDGKP